MLVAWMIYATAIGLLVAGGSAAVDRLAAIWSMPRRAVWLAALVTTTVAPIAIALRRTPPAAEPTHVQVPRSPIENARSVAPTPVPLVIPQKAAVEWSAPLAWDARAKRLWMMATLALLLVAARNLWIIRRRRGAWTESNVDGHRVLVADDSGPAVIGALRPHIVVPRWALTLAPEERALMLRHEAEHVTAHDPLVLAAAGIALILFPWNAPLWFIVQRLRLAVEIDCDARVLRHIARPREYGLLLIAVSGRRGAPLPMTAALVERRPLIERRILAMTMLRPSRPIVASIPFAALALVAVVGVAQTPKPAAAPPPPPPRASKSQASAPSAAAPRRAVPPPPAPAAMPSHASAAKPPAAPRSACCDISLDSLAVWMTAHHPNVIRGDTTVGSVVFVVAADGHYVSSETRPKGDPYEAELFDSPPSDPAAAAVGGGRRGRSGGSGENLTDAERAALPRTGIQSRQIRIGALFGSVNLGGTKIQARNVEGLQQLKLPEGRLAPGRIDVVTVFLKDN